jgi:hypothetical protein
MAVDLNSTGIVPDASGVALYERRRGGERFIVRVQNVSPGAYALRLGGGTSLPLTVPAGRSGVQLSFNVLDAMNAARVSNPLCSTISIARDGVTVLQAGSNPNGTDLCR